MSGLGGVTGSAAQINSWLLGRSAAAGKNDGPTASSSDAVDTVARSARTAPLPGDTRIADLRTQILEAVKQAISGFSDSDNRHERRSAIQTAVDGVLKANGIDRSHLPLGRLYRPHGQGQVQLAPDETISNDPISIDPSQDALLASLSETGTSDSDAGRYIQQFLTGAPTGTQFDLDA